MSFTRETPRTRWLILSAAWVVLAGALVYHTLQLKDYIRLLDALCRRGQTELTTPLQQTIPTMFADAQTWTRHSLALLETDAWRIRETQIDNAPYGREVHWHSGLSWLIAGGGWVWHAITGEPLPRAVEHWLVWLNAPLVLGLAILFSTWVARRLGAAIGVFVALGIIGHSDTYLQFVPSFADHHGLLTMANYGVVLGVLFMGAGWWLPAEKGSLLLPGSRELARGGAMFSALTGAVGMWVSAASVVPAIAIVGVAAIVATLWQGQALRAQGAVFDPGLWRRWGTVGAAASFGFYLLEYFPNHLGLRMEVNHPFYALAWWAGGELVAQICTWRLEGGTVGARLPRLVLPLLAAVAPALVIGIGGAKVFIVRDPMILQISARVAEGLTLFKAIQHYGWPVLWMRLPWALVALVPAVALLVLRKGALPRFALTFVLLAFACFVGLGFFQVRFFANTGGAEVCLIIVWLAVLAETWSPRARWTVALAVTAVLCIPERVLAFRSGAVAVETRAVNRVDVVQPLYRDIAAALRQDQPAGDIVLLTNPNASTAIGYYGRLKTIGTLYWENLAGVKAAAGMTAATLEAAARPLWAERGVTHIVLISEAAFVEEYYRMLHPEVKPDDWRQSLGFHLFVGQTVPIWLEPVPYTLPVDTLLPDGRVMIYKTKFAPWPAEEKFATARRLAVARDFAGAERAVDEALVMAQNFAEFWVLKAELLLARNALDEAARATENGYRLSPVTHRPTIASALGNEFYKRNAHLMAAQLYRASLGLREDPATFANLAWILATSTNDALRDGAAAVPLAEKAVAANRNSYHFASVLAAALAENGRFEEAVQAAHRSLEIARLTGDAAAINFAETRLKAYSARQAWRQ